MLNDRHSLSKERGTIVVFALFLLAILAAIPYAYRVAQLSRKTTSKTISTNQSRDIARGGILDAIHWFRRQTVQPVAQISDPPTYLYPDAAFDPNTSDSPKGGTIDQSLGLVKEYEFNPEKNLWARHEVRRQAVNNQTDPNATDRLAAHDITSLRHNLPAGEGISWSLVCRGIVYQRNSPMTPFDRPPNRILSESYAYSEIRKLTITLPEDSQGAIVTPAARNVHLLEFTSIAGEGAPSILTFDLTGFAENGAVLLGDPMLHAPFNMSAEDLFGVSSQDLILMSDLVVGTQMLLERMEGGNWDGVVSDNSLAYVNGKLYEETGGIRVFLNQASGILFIDGKVHVIGAFRGLVFVNEGATLYLEGLEMAGAIFSNGEIISLRSPFGNEPYRNNLVYNLSLVQEAINTNNHYREVRSSFLLGADQ